MQWLIDIILALCKAYTDAQIIICKAYTDEIVSKQHHVPSGTIVVWYGTYGNIPPGWFPCDGTNGTPNLRGRVLFGAGDGDPLHAQAGSRTHRMDPGTGVQTGKGLNSEQNNMMPYAVHWWIMKS